MSVVVGLVLVAAIISMLYMWYVTTRAGYRRMVLPAETVQPIATLSPTSPTSSAPAGTAAEATLVVYRSESAISPMELDAKAVDAIHAAYPEHYIRPFPVPLEPFYNVFRIWEKQTTWLRNASISWRTSAFQLAIMPIELFLRWTFLPTWMLIDFVDHVGIYYAALVIPKAAVEAGCSYPIPTTRFIESHDGLYAAEAGRSTPEAGRSTPEAAS